MNMPIFDGLVYIHKAQQVGFSLAQASFQAEELARSFNQVATKADINLLHQDITRIESNLDRLENNMDRFENKMDKLENRMNLLEGNVIRIESNLLRIESSLPIFQENIINKMTVRLGYMLIGTLTLLPVMIKLATFL